MGKTTLTITPGVVIEHLGQEAVVKLPGASSVVKVTGEQAHTLRAIETGHSQALSTLTVQSLIDAGIVVSETGMSHRNLFKAGTIDAGAGIAVMAMPTVDAASSPGEGGDRGSFAFFTVGNPAIAVVTITEGIGQTPNATEGTLTVQGGRFATYIFDTSQGDWRPKSGEDPLRGDPVSFVFVIDNVTYRGTPI
jgi:hypothetical protein